MIFNSTQLHFIFEYLPRFTHRYITIEILHSNFVIFLFNCSPFSVILDGDRSCSWTDKSVKIPSFLLSDMMCVRASVHVRESDHYSEDLSLCRYAAERTGCTVRTGSERTPSGSFDIVTVVYNSDSGDDRGGERGNSNRDGDTRTNGGRDGVIKGDKKGSLPPRRMFVDILKGRKESQSR